MPRVIMTANEYIRRLEVIAARPTYYSNKWPYNLCYIHNDGRTSADCWNLIKSILNGYDVNNTTVGYYQRNLDNTGDVGIDGLFKQCTSVSTDFTKLKNGEPRLLGMPDHAGTFIGERVINGKIYNVIESTGSWERKVLYSYVDESGWRRHYKGAAKNGRWTKHGKMTAWLDYGNSAQTSENTANPVANKKDDKVIAKEVLDGKWGNGVERKSRLTAAGYDYSAIQKIVNNLCKKPEYTVEYTVKKNDTLSGIAKKNGTTIDAIMALNPQIKNKNLIYPGQVIRIK